jgi:chemotaxis protein methyltransferase CheR
VAAGPADLRQPTAAEFRAFQELVLEESGIWLSEMKKALLAGRLARRLRELGLHTFSDYHDRVRADPVERVRMIDLLCTHETHFFREPRQFEHIEQVLLPRLRALAESGRHPRRVRAWSAACSSGEEPFSLAMLLLSAFPPGSGWSIEILASDLSTRILERARAAVWPVARASEIPPAYLKRFMLRGVGREEGRMKACPELRHLVRFERINLKDESYAVEGPFDLILCRNVLIYFQADEKLRVVGRFARLLAPEGCLYLGHSESLLGTTSTLAAVGPNTYALPAAETARKRAS